MQFQKKEKRQTTVRFDSHHVRLRTGEIQRKTGSYMYRWTDKLGKRNTIYAIMILPMQRKTHRFTKRLSQRCLITLRRNTMFSRMAGYQAFRTGIKATAIFLLGEKQTVSNGIKQDGSMAWMQHRPQMRIRPLFADTGILRMAIANTNTRGPSLEKMRTFLPIMVPDLLP